MAKKINIENIVNEYVADVLSGRLPSCRMVVLACQRYLDDWKRDDIYFDWKAVEKFVAFSSSLKHFKGEFAGDRKSVV